MKLIVAGEPLAAAKEALMLLEDIQEKTEGTNGNMPWPEIDRLEQAIKRAGE